MLSQKCTLKMYKVTGRYGIVDSDLSLEAEVGAGDDAGVEEAGQVEGERRGVEVLLGVGQGLVAVMQGISDVCSDAVTISASFKSCSSFVIRLIP